MNKFQWEIQNINNQTKNEKLTSESVNCCALHLCSVFRLLFLLLLPFGTIAHFIYVVFTFKLFLFSLFSCFLSLLASSFLLQKPSKLLVTETFTCKRSLNPNCKTTWSWLQRCIKIFQYYSQKRSRWISWIIIWPRIKLVLWKNDDSRYSSNCFIISSVATKRPAGHELVNYTSQKMNSLIMKLQTFRKRNQQEPQDKLQDSL